MKNLLRVIIFLVGGLLFSACGQTVTATPTPIPSPTATFTPIPSPTAAATIEPTPMSEYVQPTLIPTIDPTLLPELLSKAFSIQTVEGVNRHKIKQIIGWDHGFGAGMWQYSCPGYYWLDKNHLLLYPQAGQRQQALVTDAELTIGIAPQSAIINIDNGVTWLPPVSTEAMSVICDRVYWSPSLGILINAELHNDTATVSTYTYDGYKLASYPGSLADVSPSGTKILIGENTLIDLRTNKAIKLAWNLEDYQEPILSDLYWTYPDETRVYRCCYFYADLNTGISHRFKRSDFQDTHGIHLDEVGLWFHQGEWVRDNKYFLVHWLAVDDGPVRYQPLFDPATKLFYDLWKLAGISPDLTWRYNEVSPDRNYVWIVGFEGSYLVNLITFESQYYPYQDPYTYADVNWSANSKFVWSQTYTSDDKPTKFQILSILDRKLNPLPVTPLPDSDHWWHPTKAILVYPAADKNALIFLDTSTMSYQEMPFNLYKLPPAYGNVVYGKVVWSPTGEKLALVAEDGSLWQVGYPALENLEQLTPPLPNVTDVNWSHDGSSIGFISGSDIYIVEANK